MLAPMLIDLLIDAGAAVPDTAFGRLMRSLDRSLLMMAEIDERSRAAAMPSAHAEPGPRVRTRRAATQAGSRPSMITSPEAMTAAPAI